MKKLTFIILCYVYVIGTVYASPLQCIRDKVSANGIYINGDPWSIDGNTHGSFTIMDYNTKKIISVFYGDVEYFDRYNSPGIWYSRLTWLPTQTAGDPIKFKMYAHQGPWDITWDVFAYMYQQCHCLLLITFKNSQSAICSTVGKAAF